MDEEKEDEVVVKKVVKVKTEEQQHDIVATMNSNETTKRTTILNDGANHNDDGDMIADACVATAATSKASSSKKRRIVETLSNDDRVEKVDDGSIEDVGVERVSKEKTMSRPKEQSRTEHDGGTKKSKRSEKTAGGQDTETVLTKGKKRRGRPPKKKSKTSHFGSKKWEETRQKGDRRMVAATGWASSMDPRRCALCGRCGIQTDLTPDDVRAAMKACGYGDADELAAALWSHGEKGDTASSSATTTYAALEPRQRWRDIPASKSELRERIETWFATWTAGDPSGSEKSFGVDVSLAAWYLRQSDVLGLRQVHVYHHCGSGTTMAFDDAGHMTWIHQECASMSRDIRRDECGRWFNVLDTVRVARDATCTRCKKPGATVQCSAKACSRLLHYPCVQAMKSSAWREHTRLMRSILPTRETRGGKEDHDDASATSDATVSSSHVTRYTIPSSMTSVFFCENHLGLYNFHSIRDPDGVVPRTINPLKLVGHEVEKEFSAGGRYAGVIWHYDPCARYFRIVYEDDDAEELTMRGVCALLVEENHSTRLEKSKQRWQALKSALLLHRHFDNDVASYTMNTDNDDSFDATTRLKLFISEFDRATFPIEGATCRSLRRLLRNLSYAANEEESKLSRDAVLHVLRQRLMWWGRIKSHLADLTRQLDHTLESQTRSADDNKDEAKATSSPSSSVIDLRPLWAFRLKIIGDYHDALDAAIKRLSL